MKKIILIALLLPLQSFAVEFQRGTISPRGDRTPRCPNVVCAGDDKAATYEFMCRKLRRDGHITEFSLPVLFTKFRNSTCVCFCDSGSVDAVKYGW